MMEVVVAKQTEAPDVDEKRSAMVSIRLTKDQVEVLRREAEESGESVSEFVRRVLIGYLGGGTEMNIFGRSATVVGSGIALESRFGQLVPVSSSPYVSALIPG